MTMMNYLVVLFLLFSAVTTGKCQNDSTTERVITFPGENIKFHFVLIPGGEFTLGSPDGTGEEDEYPQRTVKVDSFWMGKFEITWEQFELFTQRKEALAVNKEAVDAITGASPPYEDPTFGMGKEGYPAVSMTQFSALVFCKWLGAVTGHFFRLPTEAEWEYACRAGSTDKYSFGDDPSELDQYAWYLENSDYVYHEVGKKRPNAWGLYDMHGNVAEWTLDQYYVDFYQSISDSSSENPWAKPASLYPRTVRGGAFIHPAEELRCANRIPSDPAKWKKRDPQIPKSFWWNTDSPFVGFRIVIPVNEPTEEEQEEFWSLTIDD